MTKDLYVRDWVLKCCASVGMLYKNVAKDVFDELSRQMLLHQNTRIWVTAISSILELFSNYGIEHFEPIEANPVEVDDGAEPAEKNNTVQLFVHIFDTCDNLKIRKALIVGLSRLVLSGHHTLNIVSKLMLEYFITKNSSEINQILGVFFETLIRRGQQDCLQKALFDTVFMLLKSFDGKFNVAPDTLIKFVIASTMPANRNANGNIHNDLAVSFLDVIINKGEDEPELAKALAKEIVNLRVSPKIFFVCNYSKLLARKIRL